MSDYISREIVLRLIERNRKNANVCKFKPTKEFYLLAHDHIKELIELIPSADVVEVKRGAWLRNRFGDTECGVCGLTLESFMEGVFYNYCPNCGADMRGE